jgi:hypothetical protein
MRSRHLNILHWLGCVAAPSRLALIALACLSVACNTNPFSTLPTDTTATPAQSVTETLEGRVNVNGATAHPFAVEVAGAVTATLFGVDPSDAVVGISLGTWNSSTNVCQVILANDGAVAGSTIIGTASVAGTFCIRLIDVGKLTGPATYAVSITHY